MEDVVHEETLEEVILHQDFHMDQDMVEDHIIIILLSFLVQDHITMDQDMDIEEEALEV